MFLYFITTVYFSIFPKYCNNALYSENKRYVLLKKKMILISAKSGVILLDRTERWRTWRRNATRPRPTGTSKGLSSESGTRGRSERSSRRGRDQREGPKVYDRAPGIKPVVGEDKAQGEGGTKDGWQSSRNRTRGGRGPSLGREGPELQGTIQSW